jgi:cation diffusion facilitator CzcD-associated flavoprotein CzcO
MPGQELRILEGRDCIGGTWDLFRYPGIRSDSDMFTLGYSFKPWTEPKAIADGPRILNYVRETAAENGIDKEDPLQPSRQAGVVVVAERAGPWRPSAAGRARAAETVRFTCNFLFMCSGYYKYEEGYTPEFPGSEDFAGRIVHPQKWPDDIDYAGKRVVVIGSGATAVTLVPEMAKTAAHVTMLQRSPTYVVARPAQDPLANKLRRNLPREARLSFDPLAQRAVRHVFLPAQPAQARARQGADPRRRQDGARSGLRHRHAFHAALQSLGAAAVPGARWRPVQGDQGGQARLGRHQRDRHLHQKRHPAEGRQRASKPTSSSPRPGSICRCSAASRSASTAARSISPGR